MALIPFKHTFFFFSFLFFFVSSCLFAFWVRYWNCCMSHFLVSSVSFFFLVHSSASAIFAFAVVPVKCVIYMKLVLIFCVYSFRSVPFDIGGENNLAAQRSRWQSCWQMVNVEWNEWVKCKKKNSTTTTRIEIMKAVGRAHAWCRKWFYRMDASSA